jgi:hypothetical protein
MTVLDIYRIVSRGWHGIVIRVGATLPMVDIAGEYAILSVICDAVDSGEEVGAEC